MAVQVGKGQDVYYPSRMNNPAGRRLRNRSFQANQASVLPHSYSTAHCHHSMTSGHALCCLGCPLVALVTLPYQSTMTVFTHTKKPVTSKTRISATFNNITFNLRLRQHSILFSGSECGDPYRPYHIVQIPSFLSFSPSHHFAASIRKRHT
jgi:hypothetical protein